MKYPKWAVIVDVAPRSKKASYYVGKLDEDFDYPLYRVRSKSDYFEDAAARVQELNRANKEDA